jgi:hypothetical protein
MEDKPKERSLDARIRKLYDEKLLYGWDVPRIAPRAGLWNFNRSKRLKCSVEFNTWLEWTVPGKNMSKEEYTDMKMNIHVR